MLVGSKILSQHPFANNWIIINLFFVVKTGGLYVPTGNVIKLRNLTIEEFLIINIKQL